MNFGKNLYKSMLAFMAIPVVITGSFFAFPMKEVKAEVIDYQAEAENRKLLPVQSNETEGWPEGPSIGAQGAILMDADSGAILYAKNIHEQLYPASVTKILTTLIATENCDLNEVVTFSHDAVFSIPYNSSNIAIDEGEELTVDQCLQAILIASANEVSNALGEHIAGSMEGFADMMNARAKELGCQDSHFVTVNGLHDDNHYTSAYDLALIGRYFFANELLCKYASTSKLHLAPTDKQPDDIVAWCKNDMLPGRTYAYEHLVAGKTGYTDSSRQTLVSCAEKDGMRLICVILKEESPHQFTDTIDLFNYGFGNFQKVNVSEAETRFNINNAEFFYSNNDIFGNSQPILSINNENTVILPKTADFSETESVISYDEPEEGAVGTITYTYHGTFVGKATIDLAHENVVSYEFDGEMTEQQQEAAAENKEENIIFVNVKMILLCVVGIAGGIIFVIILTAFIRNYQFGEGIKPRRKNRRGHRRRRGSGLRF